MKFKKDIATAYYFGAMSIMFIVYGVALQIFGMLFNDPPAAIKWMMYPAAAGAMISLVSRVWWEQTSPCHQHYKFQIHCRIAGIMPSLIFPALLILVNLLFPNLIT